MKTLKYIFFLLFIINKLNGQNIGIGTLNPEYKLDVEGNILADYLFVNELRYRYPNQSFDLLARTNATEQEFWFGKNNAIYVNQAGDVGINTLDPEVKLHVNGVTSCKRLLTNERIKTPFLDGKNLFTFFPTYNTYWMGNGAISAKPEEKVIFHQTTNDSRHIIKNKLVIEGSLQVGSLGTAISLIKKVSLPDDLPWIYADDHLFREYTVPGAMPGDQVILSLDRDLPTSVGLTGSYVSAPNIVRVKYYNENNIAYNPGSMNVRIAILRFNG